MILTNTTKSNHNLYSKNQDIMSGNLTDIGLGFYTKTELKKIDNKKIELFFKLTFNIKFIIRLPFLTIVR